MSGPLFAGSRATRWETAAVVAVLVAAAAAYGWDLDEQGWANAYYSAAAQAGAHSWSAFLFGSLEVGNAVSTDKPPASLWLMALSLRALGTYGWALLLPQVLESVVTILVLHRTVRLLAGRSAALVAAVVLATTPVFLVLARFDDPDTLLTLLLVVAAYCTVRATRSDERRWLVAVGALLGAAFLTKWSAAFLPLPAIAATLVAPRRRTARDHLRRLAVVAAAAVASGLWWVVLMLAVPSRLRPYADASGGSVLNLIAGQDGISRLGSGGMGAGNPIGGRPGLLRLLEQPYSGQIAWLLPAALLGLAVPALLRVRRPLGYLLFGVWLVVPCLTFSLMAGSTHPYYTVLVAPAMAALIGMAGSDLWRAGRTGVVLAVAASTSGYAVWLDRSYTGGPHWLPMAVAGLVGSALGLHLAGRAWLGCPPTVRRAAPVLATLGLVCAPLTFALATVRHPITGSDPLAGPGSRAVTAPYPAALVRYLRSQHHRETWIAALPTATPSSRLQLQAEEPVLPLGGFTGHTPSPTVPQLQTWVAQDRLRFVVFAGPYASDPGSEPATLRGTATAGAVHWARAHGCPVAIPGSRLLVLDLEEDGCPRAR